MSTLIKYKGSWKKTADKSYIPLDVFKQYNKSVSVAAYSTSGQWYYNVVNSLSLNFVPDGFYVLHVSTPIFSQMSGSGLIQIRSNGLLNDTSAIAASMSNGTTNVDLWVLFKRDKSKNIGNVISADIFTGVSGMMLAGNVTFDFIKLRDL